MQVCGYLWGFFLKCILIEYSSVTTENIRNMRLQYVVWEKFGMKWRVRNYQVFLKFKNWFSFCFNLHESKIKNILSARLPSIICGAESIVKYSFAYASNHVSSRSGFEKIWILHLGILESAHSRIRCDYHISGLIWKDNINKTEE